MFEDSPRIRQTGVEWVSRVQGSSDGRLSQESPVDEGSCSVYKVGVEGVVQVERQKKIPKGNAVFSNLLLRGPIEDRYLTVLTMEVQVLPPSFGRPEF